LHNAYDLAFGLIRYNKWQW